jgi:hypothetical protein
LTDESTKSSAFPLNNPTHLWAVDCLDDLKSQLQNQIIKKSSLSKSIGPWQRQIILIV